MPISPADFDRTNILVVGDVMLDRYVWGKVGRISPEAPVPVVKVERISETLGGAGNVANNLAALGCTVTLIGLCGRDERAASLRQLLAQKAVHHNLIEDPSRPTITKTRIMAEKQQVLRLDEERAHMPSAQLVQQLRDRLSKALKQCQVVILSDYGKGLFASHELVQEVIGMVRLQRLPILVDPKGGQWDRYQHATCITPNTAELEAAAGMGR